MKRAMGFIGLIVILAATTTAEACVTRIEVSRREAIAGGQAFGSVGPYEKVVGRFHGELCYRDRSFVPLAKSRAEREAKGDPRPSLEERYRDKADYVAKVRQAALALEREGYLLPEDVQRVQDSAAATPW